MEHYLCLMVTGLTLHAITLIAGTRTVRVPLQLIDDRTTSSAQASLGQNMGGTADEPLAYDQYNLRYYGVISMGTPPQEMKVLFDTSTSYFSVLSSYCQDPECTNHRLYNHTGSSTFVPLPGKLSQDTVRIAGLTIQRQVFSESSVPIPDVTGEKFDGVVGTGRAETDLVPLFYNMVKQGLVEKPVFSFYLRSGEDTTSGSILTLGGVNPSHYRGEIIYFPTTSSDNYWEIGIQSIKPVTEKGTNICGSVGGCKAYIDTGTSYIRVPNDLVDDLNSELKAFPTPSGMWAFNCTHVDIHPNVAFIIGGKEFVMTPEHYILGQHSETTSDDGHLCLSAFAPMHIPASPSVADEDTWRLGTAFISAFYTVLDSEKNQVGLAIAL